VGYNISIGGGLGFTHNNEKSHPRLADVVGFVKREDAHLVAEAVLAVNRDFGDRTNRKHARVKYTVEDYGKEFYLEQVNAHLGFDLEPARPYKFGRRGDFIGWHQTEDGLHHVGLLIPIGRVKGVVKTGLYKIAHLLRGGGIFRMTCNQQLVLSDIPEKKKSEVLKLLNEHSIPFRSEALSGLRRNMVACVAMPTCPLAFAEAERYLPTLVERLEVVTERCGLRDDDITIRMTGCPNSCGRPSMAEIGFIGKAPGTYNMYLGGDFIGKRLNTLFAESVTEDQIIELLTPMLGKYASERKKEESFGDFLVRNKYVKPMLNGRDWWKLPQV
jgi:sulfite reductase (NADPH) hemoprotein beta-component